MGHLKSAYHFLFTLSVLEKNRVKETNADPRNLSDFQSLEQLITHSLKAPALVRTQTVTGVGLPRAENVSRSFRDETLIKKLIQHRDQIPLSGRIIRP